jgi:hypothetical protein
MEWSGPGVLTVLFMGTTRCRYYKTEMGAAGTIRNTVNAFARENLADSAIPGSLCPIWRQ